MNRQALPSILLSVSIVCFFAIGLYHRHGEPRRPPHKNGPPNSDGVRTDGSDRAGALSRAAPGGDMKASSPGSSPDPVTSALAVQQGGARRELARASSPDARTKADGTASRRRAIETPATAVRVATNRATHRGASEAPPQQHPAEPAPEPAARLARAPFTVVGSGETMADVARRVYGTTDDVESLWRANRDIPRDSGSPLAPGTVLHTPAPPPR